MMPLTVIVVSYNTREMTLACLRSLRSTDGPGPRVIVVDNASTDGSGAAISRCFGDAVTLIESPQNLGFAAANNLASRSASSGFLLLLNPDTVVQPGALEALISFAAKEADAGIWGGRTVFPDGSLNPTSCWRRMTLWNQICRACGLTGLFPNSALFNSEAYGGWQRDSVRRVDIVTGCFLLIRRSLWDNLGGFDESFFMYGEEADLCLRARKLGARPVVTPAATVLHYGGASERIECERIIRILRARVQLINRHWSALTRWAGVSLTWLWCATRALLGRSSHQVGVSSSREHISAAWPQVWRRRSEWLMKTSESGELPNGVATETG